MMPGGLVVAFGVTRNAVDGSPTEEVEPVCALDLTITNGLWWQRPRSEENGLILCNDQRSS